MWSTNRTSLRSSNPKMRPSRRLRSETMAGQSSWAWYRTGIRNALPARTDAHNISKSWQMIASGRREAISSANCFVIRRNPTVRPRRPRGAATLRRRIRRPSRTSSSGKGLAKSLIQEKTVTSRPKRRRTRASNIGRTMGHGSNRSVWRTMHTRTGRWTHRRALTLPGLGPPDRRSPVNPCGFCVVAISRANGGLVNCFHLRPEDFPCELRGGFGVPRAAHRRCLRGVFDDSSDGPRQGGHIGPRKEQSIDAVADEVRDAPDPGRDDRNPLSPALQDHNPLGLVEARKDETCRAREEAPLRLLVHLSREDDPIPEPEGACLSLQEVPHPAVGSDEAERTGPVVELCRGAHQMVRGLFAMQPTQEEDIPVEPEPRPGPFRSPGPERRGVESGRHDMNPLERKAA